MKKPLTMHQKIKIKLKKVELKKAICYGYDGLLGTSFVFMDVEYQDSNNKYLFNTRELVLSSYRTKLEEITKIFDDYECDRYIIINV